MPVFVTRWCLSQGIEETTAWEVPGGLGWCVVASGRMRNTILMEGQWFKTKAEAVKEANKVLASALRSARARVEDLESVVFTTEGKSHERVGDRAGEGASNDETGTQGQHEPAF